MEEEGRDPREELVRKLIEYQAYKEAAKELGALDGTNVVHEVSREIRGLKNEVQKSLQALQSEVTTATTIAPPTTASPVIPSPPPPTNGEAPTITPPDTNPASSKPPTQPSYSAWIDKSTKN